MARPSKPHKTSLGYWRVRIDGVEYHLGRDKAKAHQKFHRLMVQAGKTGPERPGTVAGLIARWLDKHPGDDHRHRLADLLERCGRISLSAVDRETLTEYHRHLKRRKLAPKTIVDRMRIARRVFRWALRREPPWIFEEPDMPRLARPVRKARDIPREALVDAFRELPTQAGRVLTFILETGARPCEAVRLRWTDVDLATGTCVLGEHKTAGQTGRPRTLYLGSSARRILESTPKHSSGYVFTSRLGKPYTVSGLRSILRRRGGWTPYQLRHSFAQLASEQIPEEELRRLLGHTGGSTITRHYYEVRDQRARKAAERLEPVLPLDILDQPASRKRKPGSRRKAPSAGDRRRASRRVS